MVSCESTWISAVWREAGRPVEGYGDQPRHRPGKQVRICARTGRDELREAAGVVVLVTSGRG